MLSKYVNLDNPESVKGFIASKDSWSNAYKEGIVNAYTHYVREYDLSWEKPIYKRRQRLPIVPSTEQVNKIIAHAGRKHAWRMAISRKTQLLVGSNKPRSRSMTTHKALRRKVFDPSFSEI